MLNGHSIKLPNKARLVQLSEKFVWCTVVKEKAHNWSKSKD